MTRFSRRSGCTRSRLDTTVSRRIERLPQRIDDPRRKLSKDIYPKIAQKHNVRPDNVERSIRNAICAADSDPISHEHMRALIGNVRPSNSEVISALTQKLSEEFFRDSPRD